MFRNLLIIWALLSSSIFADPQSTSQEILTKLQRTIESSQDFDELSDVLVDTSVEDLKFLSTTFERGWKKARLNYQKNLTQYLKSSHQGSAQGDKKRRVRELRKSFFEIYVLSEDNMKSKLPEISQPALDELRVLLLPEMSQVLSQAPEGLKKERKILLGYAQFRDLLQEHSISVGAEDSPQEILSEEKQALAPFQDLDRKGLRIMEENDKIAAKAELPPLERRGIRELNEWRLLLGLNALQIDPKLCEAGRGHSQDMNENNFFAHESPIEGKKTPSDRARLAGTSGGGENIFVGRDNPEAANKGWFFSPGHHKNLFRANYKRVGLGQFERHWTQMFGR